MRGDTSDGIPALPDLNDPHARHLRQAFLAVITAGCVLMVPWIAYLAVALPDHHSEHAWKLAWVGFDIALGLGLSATAVAAWRRRQITVVAAVVTATLLCCDAWFDVALDWGTGDELWSLLSALLAEIPLAAYLMFVALRIIRLSIRSALLLAGHRGPVPPLHKLSIMGLAELTASAGERPGAQVSARTPSPGTHGPR
jgi:hypothetical protein